VRIITQIFKHLSRKYNKTKKTQSRLHRPLSYLSTVSNKVFFLTADKKLLFPISLSLLLKNEHFPTVTLDTWPMNLTCSYSGVNLAEFMGDAG